MVFIDTWVWFAAAVTRDKNSTRARAILETIDQPVTTGPCHR
jgi:predicted nucleic acid-binding protein